MKVKAWIGLVVLMVVCAMPAGAQQFLGDELKLSTDHETRVRTPGVGFFDSGGLVVAWERALDGLVVRTFDAAGEPQGAELLLVQDDPLGPLPFRGVVATHVSPQVVPVGPEAFLLIWTRETAETAVDIFFFERNLRSQEIFVQRFEQGGTPVGSPVRISEAGVLSSRPAAARLADGSVVVLWDQDGSEHQVVGRRLDETGQPLAPQFAVGEGQRADVAALPNGSFVAVWDGCCDAGSDLGVFARRFTGEGLAVGDPQAINDRTVGRQGVPRVAAAANGLTLVAWQGPALRAGEEEARTHVLARALTPAGTFAGPERWVSEQAFGDDHSSPVVAAVPGQGFFLTWMGWKSDVRYGVVGAYLNSTGVTGTPFQISQNRIHGQFELGLAHSAGRTLISWIGFHDGEAVIAGRFLGTNTQPALGVCASVEGGLPFDLLSFRNLCSD